MLFGVDLVEVDRVDRAVALSGPVYLGHMNAPDEPGLHDNPTLAVAASVAVKECLVKAVGGRPPGFSWHDFVARGDIPFAGFEWARPLLDAAEPEIVAATEVALSRSCVYTVRGASRVAALTRFTTDPAGGGLAVAGAARWGWSGNLIVAFAIIITFPEGVDPCP